ncbi:hypothetical protein ACWT_3162 [Actinoplanes sp. SE50]|nr:hypothetical protein ACPL_3290 [Actinoplanes sp. SE50/110]ATO82577.1 hypothetical protein ACWT_3162 [Actinoplanes sp. SE50]SLL99984.1 hypothetical protein ACSP50_3216 [Actinoplanes sp. SE50/110]
MPPEDIRPLFTAPSAARVRPALALHLTGHRPGLILDADTIGLLRDGLGYFDMEIRWMAHLDDADTVRMWRSWTGFQVYEAQVRVRGSGESAVFTDLKVEQHPDRYSGRLHEEPALFERILISSVNHLRHFRAGHTPYGPSPSAGPLPDPWPDETLTQNAGMADHRG